MTGLRMIWYQIRGLLLELSDQAAYRRHLADHRLEDSPAEWRRFLDRRFQSKYARAKCC